MTPPWRWPTIAADHPRGNGPVPSWTAGGYPQLLELLAHHRVHATDVDKTELRWRPAQIEVLRHVQVITQSES